MGGRVPLQTVSSVVPSIEPSKEAVASFEPQRALHALVHDAPVRLVEDQGSVVKALGVVGVHVVPTPCEELNLGFGDLEPGLGPVDLGRLTV